MLASWMSPDRRGWQARGRKAEGASFEVRQNRWNRQARREASIELARAKPNGPPDGTTPAIPAGQAEGTTMHATHAEASRMPDRMNGLLDAAQAGSRFGSILHWAKVTE